MRGDDLVVGWLFLVVLRFVSWISCVSWMKGAEAMCVCERGVISTGCFGFVQLAVSVRMLAIGDADR
ncbi:MAG: hypothetical protein ACKPJD_30825 [Planctomycetaceae bacterium]